MTASIQHIKSSEFPDYKLGSITKFNYGIGDFGNNIIWHTMGLWLAYFYTDVYGLSAIHVGTMYLVVRIFDAITDPLVGLWVDRTRTKYGSCRPFILYGTIPLAITFIMLFYTPDLSDTGKLIYAYTSYALLTLAYTLVNVPFSSMAGFLTRDSDERTVLQSFRFGLGMLASVFVSYTTLSLVASLGEGNEQQGFFYTAIVFSLLIMACLYYCFFTVKEVYPAPPLGNNNTKPIKQLVADIKAAFKNKQLVILFLGNILFFITLTLKATPSVYYVKEVLINAEHLLTTFMTWGTVGATLGAALSAVLWTRFDKVRAYKALMFICGILTAIPYWMSGTDFLAILSLGVIVSFLSLSMVPLIWSMLSDVVDYQLSLTGKNMSGLFFALFLFTLKVGLGVGGALSLWIMGETGYIANIPQQSAEVVESINFISTLLPGILFISAGMIMMFYTLNKEKRTEIKIKLYGE
ncbi:glycoside-pentoside-hexuronide (GPH):cation symporter [Thalassotalea sp. SU-HH00458]|uniref:glycoside-pentoside-hexuronide (GPH):cation symporter n=1 Tax=Thalassotalea sp. SU-HH00458 TaxID=3127657 RepID=UPI00310C047E